MTNMKKYSFFFILFTSVAFFSCKKEGYKAPASNTVAMAGRWWYELIKDANSDGIFNEDDGDELLVSYADYGAPDLITTNTNANDKDSVLITDQFSPGFGQWPFKVHVPVDVASLTFTPASGLLNKALSDGETVRVIEGKILKNAATTLSGGRSDSIFLRLEFSDDEGTQYMFSGLRDTGFPEDQYE